MRVTFVVFFFLIFNSSSLSADLFVCEKNENTVLTSFNHTLTPIQIDFIYASAITISKYHTIFGLGYAIIIRHYYNIFSNITVNFGLFFRLRYAF